MFEERIEKAVEFFKSGYNCSQSVVLAFCRHVWIYARTGGAYGSFLRWRYRSYASDLWRCMRYVSALPDWKPEAN